MINPPDTPETNLPPRVTSPEISLFKSPSRAEAPLWSLRDLAIFFGLSALAGALAYVVVLTSYVALHTVAGWHVPPRDPKESLFLSLSLQSVFYLLLFASVYFLVAIYHKRPFWTSVGWQTAGALGGGLYFLGGILLAVSVLVAPPLLPDTENFPLEKMFTSPGAAYGIAAFAVLVAPFMEELVFRGVLFAVFERQVGLRFAVVATALLFAGLHVPEYRGAWNHLMLIFFVGVAFSLARGLTRSLVPSVILHTAYNFSQMVALYLATHHFRSLGEISAL